MLADCEPTTALAALGSEPAAVGAYDKVPFQSGNHVEQLGRSRDSDKALSSFPQCPAAAGLVFTLDTSTETMTLHAMHAKPVGGGQASWWRELVPTCHAACADASRALRPLCSCMARGACGSPPRLRWIPLPSASGRRERTFPWRPWHAATCRRAQRCRPALCSAAPTSLPRCAAPTWRQSLTSTSSCPTPPLLVRALLGSHKRLCTALCTLGGGGEFVLRSPPSPVCRARRRYCSARARSHALHAVLAFGGCVRHCPPAAAKL